MAGQGTNRMNIRYFSFGRFHGKQETQGSTYIRMKQMEPFVLPYKYGENPDVLIFQKVYCTEDYKFPTHFEKIKILDICDPDWINGSSIVETCKAMDAVTCPTKAIADFISQFHDNVHVVPDRFDLSLIGKPKTHSGEAKTVVWFGYSHNAEAMKPAMKVIDELNLNLIVISNDDPLLHQWTKREGFYTFLKYDENTIYDELKESRLLYLTQQYAPNRQVQK